MSVAATAGSDVAPATRVPTTVRQFFFEDPHFKDTWDNFDSVKDAMLKESMDLRKKMLDDFKQMRCLTGGQEGGLDVAVPESSWMFPRRWMMPALSGQQTLGDLDLFGASSDHEVIRFKQDENQLEVSLDTSHYRPDELHVNVKDGFVTIEGKHEEKSKDNKSMLTRHFKRMYSLPEGTRMEDVTSNLSTDGVLVVKALKGQQGTEVKIQKLK